MNKCNFNYLYSKPNYAEIDMFIIYLTNKYKNELQTINLVSNNILLNYNQDNFINLIKQHKQIVIDIIKEVISFFKELDNIPHTIFIHGSFAKSLNRINSDIDLNILYPNKFKKEILPIEELISIILQKVLNYSGRDKIHTMMIYSVDEIDTSLIESTKECTITFPCQSIYNYECRPNYDEVMYKIKNSSREHTDFTQYISNHIHKCEEWCYSFEEIFTNQQEFNLYETLLQKERASLKQMTTKDYISIIDDLIAKINSYQFSIAEENTISAINKNIKVRNLELLYSTLALIKRFLLINQIETKNLNFFELFENNTFKSLFTKEELKEIEENIFMYLWQLSRMENMFKTNGINFSSRNYTEINPLLLFNHYTLLYNDDVRIVQSEATNNLHHSLRHILRKIKNN